MKNRVSNIIVGLVLLGTLFSWPAGMVKAVGAIVSQNYASDESIAIASLVSRKPDDGERVVQANSNNRPNIVGVVIDKSDSFVAYSSSQAGVAVATSGTVNINVSTVNGDIKVGDQLTASPVSGFAMKATGAGKVVGRAVADFSKSTNGAQIRSIATEDGRSLDVAIGIIPADIMITDWVGQTGSQNVLVDGLTSFTSNVTGRTVSASNAILAALVLALAVLVSGIILFTSVGSSIKSLGRNPLSHAVIRRSLAQVILIVIALLTAAIVVAFLIIGR
ncbi:hypothetical protein KBC99_00865 [Candidatus Saccharibacteria bacterium]|nr:hypothetical protein [Candidatus Saccharibacteria bacterium]